MSQRHRLVAFAREIRQMRAHRVVDADQSLVHELREEDAGHQLRQRGHLSRRLGGERSPRPCAERLVDDDDAVPCDQRDEGLAAFLIPLLAYRPQLLRRPDLETGLALRAVAKDRGASAFFLAGPLQGRILFLRSQNLPLEREMILVVADNGRVRKRGRRARRFHLVQVRHQHGSLLLPQDRQQDHSPGERVDCVTVLVPRRPADAVEGHKL